MCSRCKAIRDAGFDGVCRECHDRFMDDAEAAALREDRVSADDLIRRSDVLRELYVDWVPPKYPQDWANNGVIERASERVKALPPGPLPEIARAAVDALSALLDHDNFYESDYACETEWLSENGDDEMCPACAFRGAVGRFRAAREKDAGRE